jgi:WD40 repeat protein
LSCDFFNNDKYIVVTNLEGDASIISLEDNMNIIKHETIETNERTNIAYCCSCVRQEDATFLIGSENKLITKFRFDPKDLQVEKLGFFKGHSNSVRHVAVSKSTKHLLSTCEDHSLRIWDYKEYNPLMIFSGHKDNVVRILN